MASARLHQRHQNQANCGPDCLPRTTFWLSPPAPRHASGVKDKTHHQHSNNASHGFARRVASPYFGPK